MKIIKRSGAENTFDKEKIENAVAKANITVEEKDRLSEGEIGEIAQNIEDKCSEMNRAMDVETIQDWVENKDFFLIRDACHTELEPEEFDENGEGMTLTCIGFRPLPDEIAHQISHKFHLY